MGKSSKVPRSQAVAGDRTASALFPLTREQTLMERAESVTFTVYLDDQKEDKVKISAPVFLDSLIKDYFKWRKALSQVIQQ